MPPWELMKRSKEWLGWAIASQNAENIAESEAAERRRREADRGRH